MPNGKFNDKVFLRLKELGEKIEKSFGTILSEDAEISIKFIKSETQPKINVKLPEKRKISFYQTTKRLLF